MLEFRWSAARQSIPAPTPSRATTAPWLGSHEMEQPARVWSVAACGLLVAVLGACSDSMSLTEYADGLEQAAFTASRRFHEPETTLRDVDATLEEAQSAVKETATIRREFHEDSLGLDPPEQMAELHALLITAHADLVDAQQAWADSADRAGSAAELAQNAEAQVFVEVGEAALEVCRQLQAAFDSTTERTVREGTPLPPEMKESVGVAFGCG